MQAKTSELISSLTNLCNQHIKIAEKLKTKLKATDQFITINGGTHHNLAGFKEYKSALDSILK